MNGWRSSHISRHSDTGCPAIGRGTVCLIENATLDDVHAHTDVMPAKLAELIIRLDDVSSAFSRDFDEMRSKPGWERFVGIFSRRKSESMRQERLRMANIDDKLQDLIGKSNMIVKLLQGQLEVLNDRKTKVETNLANTLDARAIILPQRPFQVLAERTLPVLPICENSWLAQAGGCSDIKGVPNPPGQAGQVGAFDARIAGIG